jgi:UDP-N-acetylmuramate dehydrogenase
MIEFLADRPLRDKTSYKIGGPAAWYAEPGSIDELARALGRARTLRLPVLVLGRGTNILVSDSGWPGFVINLSASFSAIEWENNRVTAQGGALLDAVVRESVSRGLRGMEDLSGIPGTVGGAVAMNAGAFSACVADTLHEATLLDMDNNRIDTIGNRGLGFGYRTSLAQKKKHIVLRAVFELQQGVAADLEKVRRAVLDKRKEKQPIDLPNCGSVFKRPPGGFAGALIEKAGLKGRRYGNAQISPKHANFIVNLGGGTAAEVRHLVVLAQKQVYEQSGVLLEPEVVFAGEFEEKLFKPRR